MIGQVIGGNYNLSYDGKHAGAARQDIIMNGHMLEMSNICW